MEFKHTLAYVKFHRKGIQPDLIQKLSLTAKVPDLHSHFMQWNLAYPNLKYPAAWIIQPRSQLMSMVSTEQSSYTRLFEGRSNHVKMQEFWPSEVEEAEIR